MNSKHNETQVQSKPISKAKHSVNLRAMYQSKIVQTAMQIRVEALKGGAKRLSCRAHLLNKPLCRGGRRKVLGIVGAAVVGLKILMAPKLKQARERERERG